MPEHLKPVYQKHKELFVAKIDVSLTTFGGVIKAIQARRMAACLVDIEAANKESRSFTVSCPVSFAAPSQATPPE